MATLYTERDIAKALRSLRIEAIDGKVDGHEAAKILSWRAKEEQQMDYTYDLVAIRQHVRQGHFPEGSIDATEGRHNLYKVESVFRLPIAPKRGQGRRRSILQSSQN
jgi:hypothetical protein